MKKNTLKILIIMFGLLMTIGGHAQREVRFSYDNSGNMKSRTIYLPPPPPAINTENESTNLPVNNTETNGIDDKIEEKVFEDIIGNQGIKIYPNPTKGKLTVEMPDYSYNPDDRIEIYDLSGALKRRIAPLSKSNTIQIHSYSPGTYIMIIHTKNESVQWKIIKQ